jgi:hypothetical protein
LQKPSYGEFTVHIRGGRIMPDLLEDVPPKRLVEACMDFASATSKMAREDLGWDYPAVMKIGRLGHFLQAVRHETDYGSKHHEPKMSVKEMETHAGIYGISLMDIVGMRLPSNQLVIERSDDVFRINIRTQDDVVSCCHSVWESAQEQGVLVNVQYEGICHSSTSPTALVCQVSHDVASAVGTKGAIVSPSRSRNIIVETSLFRSSLIHPPSCSYRQLSDLTCR